MNKEMTMQMRLRLNEKSTAELIAIWAQNDSDAWTPAALELCAALLVERLGQLPSPQAVAKVLGQPPHAQPAAAVSAAAQINHITTMADWPQKLSWLFLGLAVILLGFEVVQSIVQPTPGLDLWGTVQLLLFGLVRSTTTLFYFLLLQGLAAVLRLLPVIAQNTSGR